MYSPHLCAVPRHGDTPPNALSRSRLCPTPPAPKGRSPFTRPRSTATTRIPGASTEFVTSQRMPCPRVRPQTAPLDVFSHFEVPLVFSPPYVSSRLRCASSLQHRVRIRSAASCALRTAGTGRGRPWPAAELRPDSRRSACGGAAFTFLFLLWCIHIIYSFLFFIWCIRIIYPIHFTPTMATPTRG